MVFVNPLIMTAVDTIEKYEVKSGQGITILMHTGEYTVLFTLGV